MTDSMEQAQVIKRELDTKRQSNPYYHISKGNEAYVQNFIEKPSHIIKNQLNLTENFMKLILV